MNEWRSMESAPTDREILVYRSNGTIRQCIWRPDVKRRTYTTGDGTEVTMADDWGWWEVVEGSPVHDAYMWMPLPTPPA